MGFEKFGTVSFAAETKAADFVKHLEEGKVMATKCDKCGAVYFPPRVDCTKCFTSKVSWFDVGNNGKLLTYTPSEEDLLWTVPSCGLTARVARITCSRSPEFTARGRP